MATLSSPLRRLAWVALFCGLFSLLVIFKIPVCPTSILLHQPCPGCGLTRATLRLLQGDLSGALAWHPLVWLMSPTIGAYFIANTVGYVVRGEWGVVEARMGRAISPIAMVLLVAGFAVWIARFFGAFGGPVPV
ncbi:MAG: DUF2752 domain-containing protein [Polyangiaceae bacterium]